MNITDEFLIRYCDASNKIESQPIPLEAFSRDTGHLSVLHIAAYLGRHRIPLTVEVIEHA